MNKCCKSVFTLSLLLNVLLLGLAGGHFYHRWSARTWHEMQEELAPATLSMMENTFREKHEDIVPLIQQIREQRDDLKNVLTGEIFDPRAFDRASRKFADLNHRVLEQKLQTIRMLALELPAGERGKIANNFVMSALEGGHQYKAPRYLERMKGAVTPGNADPAQVQEDEEAADVYIYDLYDMFMMPGEILPEGTYGPPKPHW